MTKDSVIREEWDSSRLFPCLDSSTRLVRENPERESCSAGSNSAKATLVGGTRRARHFLVDISDTYSKFTSSLGDSFGDHIECGYVIDHKEESPARKR